MKSQDEKLKQLKDETYQTARYLELLEDEINQGNVKPIPDSVIKRIEEIKIAAENAKIKGKSRVKIK